MYTWCLHKYPITIIIVIYLSGIPSVARKLVMKRSLAVLIALSSLFASCCFADEAPPKEATDTAQKTDMPQDLAPKLPPPPPR